MHIIDSLGGIITITDLEAAIAQAEEFMNYRYIDSDSYPSLQRFDERRFYYWKDIHEKLLQLQQQSNDPE